MTRLFYCCLARIRWNRFSRIDAASILRSDSGFESRLGFSWQSAHRNMFAPPWNWATEQHRSHLNVMKRKACFGHVNSSLTPSSVK